ncbi:MAG: type II toxin-antitoxin system Phd/YefM family antitoxin [Gaiellales bacterium]
MSATDDAFDTMAITEVKAHFLRLADQIARTGRPMVVTRHGRPLIRIDAAEPPKPVELRGSITQRVSDDELIHATLGTWDMETWQP